MTTTSLAQQITVFVDSISVIEWPREPSRACGDAGPHEPLCVPKNHQARLGRLRRAAMDAAVRREGARYQVVVYAVVPAGDDPAAALELAEAYARERDWCVIDRLVDEPGNSRPWAREEWRRVLKALRGGFAQGVVTIDRSAVSLADEPYEQTLHWLLDHFSFVAHVRPRPLATASSPQ
ncbi:hypothetical protein [Streptomyces sp. NPDC002845]